MNRKHSPLCHGVLLVLALYFASGILPSQAGGAEVGDSKPETKILIQYTSSDESVEIRDTELIYRITVSQFDQKHPANPNPINSKTITKSTTVSPEALQHLVSFIESTEFFQLNNEYGGTVAGRYYGYELNVKAGDRHKKVIYRACPGAEARPEAFAKVENRILEFAREATETKQ